MEMVKDSVCGLLHFLCSMYYTHNSSWHQSLREHTVTNCLSANRYQLPSQCQRIHTR